MRQIAQAFICSCKNRTLSFLLIASALIGVGILTFFAFGNLAHPSSQAYIEESLESSVKRLNQFTIAVEETTQRLYGARDKERPDVYKEFTLVGIIWNIHQPLAVINDHIVSIGDTIADYEIIDIGKDNVVLRRGDATTDIIHFRN